MQTETGPVLANHHILLVEDEVIIAIDLRESLEEAGARVTHARTRARGLELAEAARFDAAILDVNLGNGETCEPIAEALKQRAVPFILHTGDLTMMGELVHRIGAPIASKPMQSEKLIEILIAAKG